MSDTKLGATFTPVGANKTSGGSGSGNESGGNQDGKKCEKVLNWNKNLTNSNVVADNSSKGEKKGSLKIVEGGNYSASEIKAAEYMKDLGYEVTLRPPTGTRAEGRTSDLIVNDVNYDVYTPNSSRPSNIISAIAKKNTQTTGIVLDLSKTSVTNSDLGNILARVKGSIEAGGKVCNITDIIVMPK